MNKCQCQSSQCRPVLLKDKAIIIALIIIYVHIPGNLVYPETPNYQVPHLKLLWRAADRREAPLVSSTQWKLICTIVSLTLNATIRPPRHCGLVQGIVVYLKTCLS